MRFSLSFIGVIVIWACSSQTAMAAATPTFASVPWGATASKAKAALTSKGFTFLKVDADGDLDFTGTVNGQKVQVFELMTPSHLLVKSEVIFLTADDEALTFYGNLKDTLTEKYGSPSKHYEFWSDPYTDADSQSDHETALAVGKGTFSSFWEFPDRRALDGGNEAINSRRAL